MCGCAYVIIYAPLPWDYYSYTSWLHVIVVEHGELAMKEKYVYTWATTTLQTISVLAQLKWCIGYGLFFWDVVMQTQVLQFFSVGRSTCVLVGNTPVCLQGLGDAVSDFSKPEQYLEKCNNQSYWWIIWH